MGTTINNGRMVKTNGGIMSVINGKEFVNGIEVPKEPGTYVLDGTTVEVSVGKKLSFSSCMVSNGGVINISNASCSINADKGSRCGGDGDYVVNGMNVKMRKNIYVSGDIVCSGMNCRVIRGKKDPRYENLIVKGDLVVSGMGCSIGNVVELKGSAVCSGMNSYID